MHWGTSASADCRCRRGFHRAVHRPDPRAPYHCCSNPHPRSGQDRVSVKRNYHNFRQYETGQISRSQDLISLYYNRVFYKKYGRYTLK